MRHVVLDVVAFLVLPRDVLLDFARRDHDMADDIALAQDLQRDLPAQRLAVIRVVDALALEHFGHLAERQLVARRHLLQRVVHHLVGHLDADAIRALPLDFLEHQAVEDLLAQHGERRHFLVLLLDALNDHVGLFVELALQDDAVVHHGGDAVEQDTARGELARLGASQARDQNGERSQGGCGQ